MPKLTPNTLIPLGTALALMTVVLGAAWMLQGRLTSVENGQDTILSRVERIELKLDSLMFSKPVSQSFKENPRL